MSRVTIKYVIDFFDTHRENFVNYITKEIHADIVMNSDKLQLNYLMAGMKKEKEVIIWD